MRRCNDALFVFTLLHSISSHKPVFKGIKIVFFKNR